MERELFEKRKSNGDAWLGRAVKIAALLAACSAPLLAFNNRVSRIEETDQIKLYMLCGLYRDAHPTTVPAICATAIAPLR